RILQWETTISDGVITIAPALDFIAEDGYFFLVESEGTTHIGSMEVTACWVVQESADNAPRACSGCLLYEDSFSFPIIVRTRRPGDSIELVHGLTNIEDIVKSWHISPIGRNAVPIIEDRNGIVAVLPCTEPDCFGNKPKFRNYEGPKEGRRLKIELITLKGAPTTDV
ncbi:MAG: hypothetical protein LLF89_04695, partial [Spirochaetaceae bacterium]|nr:hypothetical protein [Spirochaetaceae bacterium]